MVFSSMTFLLLFLPVTLLLYFAVRSLRWKNTILLIASLVFYAWGEPVYILVMLASSLVNWICSVCIVRSDRKAFKKLFLSLGTAASLGALGYFKYAGFFLRTVSSVFSLNLSSPDVSLPVGISFYTFQVLTYTIDVYRGEVPAQKSFFRLLLYVCCFPQLIAGPIVRYSDVALELENRSTASEDFIAGMKRFITGLAKKVIIANICGAMLAELPQGGTGAEMSLLSAWMAPVMFSLQLYFDFSAYSDMAIGLGKILGFNYKENFDYPYTSRSATEFWRRWHMSLGSFFRDYVYIPLGGNRKGTMRTVLNLLVVWILTGLWHGAEWNFVLWGLYYFVLLVLERFVLKRILPAIPSIIRHVLTLILVVIGWMIFYYTDFSALREAALGLIGLSAAKAHLPLTDQVTLSAMRHYTFFPVLAFILSLPVIPRIKEKLAFPDSCQRAISIGDTILYVLLFALSMVFLVGQSFNPFIYFRF